MSRVKVNLPDQTESEIQRLVDAGEFLDYDKAVEDLLTRGISAYETTAEDDEPGIQDEAFSNVAEEQQDPAMRTDDGDDGYTF
ncbi:CopG family transcriptional regulator [Halobacteriales archaeon Cl-PHB]